MKKTFKQVTKVLEYELPVKIEPQNKGGFVVRCPKWPDCYAQGETLDEALLEVTAVTQSLIELYREEGIHIPLKLSSPTGVELTSLSLPIFISV